MYVRQLHEMEKSNETNLPGTHNFNASIPYFCIVFSQHYDGFVNLMFPTLQAKATSYTSRDLVAFILLFRCVILFQHPCKLLLILIFFIILWYCNFNRFVQATSPLNESLR